MFDPSDTLNSSTREDGSIDFFSQLSNPDSGVWELIFDSMPDMIALIDLNNIVVKANKAMREKINIGEQSLTGHLCYNLMHDKGCAISNCPHLSMINDLKPHAIELFESKFGLHLDISTTPIFDSDNNLLGSLHIARDITIQKESEDRLLKYNNELKELNQSKDKFFSIVAHDLRSPFQGLLGFTDLILNELDTLSRKEIKDYLLKVHDSAYNTFSLLENLLNWSRLQIGRLSYNPSDFNLHENVDSIFSLLGSNAQSKNIRLINRINRNYTVFADQQMMHSILLNLVSNAIKFTYSEGTVTLDASIRSICEDNSGDSCTSNHKSMEISVLDTGTGIPPDAIEKLFKIDAHYSLTGTANEQGAGLGLILVKEMTEKHGGTLSVSSQEGKGSVFTFTLPLSDVEI